MAYSPGSPTMANTSTSRSPSAVTICWAWMSLRTAIERQPRIFVRVVQIYVRKAFVIAQRDVEARLVCLDEVVFEQQRIRLGVRDGDFDIRNLIDQRLDFGVHAARVEIAADAVF